MTRSQSNAPRPRRPSPTETGSALSPLGDGELREIERSYAAGITSRQIVDVFAARGVRFSEATLRKYVQLGLLPRSVRVGRKGKHRGSCGLYPAHVVRRVCAVKQLMAENLTIEEIQRSFAKFKDGIENVEHGLRDLLAGFEREARGPAVRAGRQQEIEQEITEAKRAVSELIRRISGLERRLSDRERAQSPAVAGEGGHDLY